MEEWKLLLQKVVDMFGLSFTFQECILLFVMVCFLFFLGVLIISLFRHRNHIKFYALVVRDDGKLSKIGVSFVFLLLLLVYQVITGTEVSSYLIELLGVVFASELGRQYLTGKYAALLPEIDEEKKKD